MAYNDYEAVKLVTAASPNLGFYSSTPAPPWVSWYQWDTAKNVFHRADIECWKLGGHPMVQHGNAIPLHAAVRGERLVQLC